MRSEGKRAVLPLRSLTDPDASFHPFGRFLNSKLYNYKYTQTLPLLLHVHVSMRKKTRFHSACIQAPTTVPYDRAMYLSWSEPLGPILGVSASSSTPTSSVSASDNKFIVGSSKKPSRDPFVVGATTSSLCSVAELLTAQFRHLQLPAEELRYWFLWDVEDIVAPLSVDSKLPQITEVLKLFPQTQICCSAPVAEALTNKKFYQIVAKRVLEADLLIKASAGGSQTTDAEIEQSFPAVPRNRVKVIDAGTKVELHDRGIMQGVYSETLDRFSWVDCSSDVGYVGDWLGRGFPWMGAYVNEKAAQLVPLTPAHQRDLASFKSALQEGNELLEAKFLMDSMGALFGTEIRHFALRSFGFSDRDSLRAKWLRSVEGLGDLESRVAEFVKNLPQRIPLAEKKMEWKILSEVLGIDEEKKRSAATAFLKDRLRVSTTGRLLVEAGVASAAGTASPSSDPSRKPSAGTDKESLGADSGSPAEGADSDDVI
jgi:hypothetical protein